jgi:hypothetical protein
MRNFRDRMFSCDSNFIIVNNFTLAIVSKCDAITYSVILIKRCEHSLLSDHMICASTIKHPTSSSGGVGLQERINLCF